MDENKSIWLFRNTPAALIGLIVWTFGVLLLAAMIIGPIVYCLWRGMW